MQHAGAQQLGAAQLGQHDSGAQQLGSQHGAGAQQVGAHGSTQHSQHTGSQPHFFFFEKHFLHQPNRPQRFLGASQHSTGQQQQSGAGAQQVGAQHEGGAQQLGSQQGALHDGGQQSTGAQHDGAQHDGAQQVGSGAHFFLQQPNRPASAELMLATSTSAAARDVNFILRSPDLFRVTVEDVPLCPSWVFDRSLEVPHTQSAWVHLRNGFGIPRQ
ncbi:MAG: hypothetical protein KDA75_20765 [Planctomycetaceae bacterium]|nr:hypothetical protein [Planctomycetaceae bacterium]